MAWFQRKDKGIRTPTKDKKDVPDGLWYKTPKGKIIHIRELKNNAYVCPDDDFHVRIGSKEYFDILFDQGKFSELDKSMASANPLDFVDTKAYPDRVKASQKKTGLKDAVRTAYGKLDGLDVTIGCMDFSFIGGSMGSVVGEKIARAIDHSLKKKNHSL
jgi:acetyl-CoA carboxylase carboxyl transferase subunit beta